MKLKKQKKKIKFGWNKDKKYDLPLSLYHLGMEKVLNIALSKK